MCIPVRLFLTIQAVFVQGLLEMEFALPTDSTESSGLSLLRRLWVARFDIEEEAQGLAEKYVAVYSVYDTLFRSVIWIIKISIILYYPQAVGFFGSGAGPWALFPADWRRHPPWGGHPFCQCRSSVNCCVQLQRPVCQCSQPAHSALPPETLCEHWKRVKSH